MRPITVFRGFAFAGVMIAGATMVMTWGDGEIKGPPAQWERQVVGALLLSAIALVALWSMGPAGTRRSKIARSLAVVCSAGAVALALVMWQDARTNDFVGLLAGYGWPWFLAGNGLCLGASVGSLSIRPEEVSRKIPARKRARGR